jgi:hypothetical protein
MPSKRRTRTTAAMIDFDLDAVPPPPTGLHPDDVELAELDDDILPLSAAKAGKRAIMVSDDEDTDHQTPAVLDADGAGPGDSPQPTLRRQRSTCSKCVANGQTPEQCAGHRADSKLHCVECLTHNGHTATCSQKDVAPSRSPAKRPRLDPLSGWFTAAHNLVFIFWTIVKTGSDMPALWWEETKNFFDGITHADIDEDYYLVKERGSKDHHLHMHACTTHRVPVDDSTPRKLITALKSHLACQPRDGTKMSVEIRSTTGQFLNTKRYISKQCNQPWFDFKSNYINMDTIKTLCEEYGETEHSDYEKAPNILKPQDMLPWFMANASAHNILDARIGDCLLWAVQKQDIRLSLRFVSPKGSATFCAEATGRFANVMRDPASATPMDIYCIVFGGRDPSSRQV